MFRFFVVLLSLLCLGASAYGGPNAGGTLNAHDADLLMTATDGNISVCGQGLVPQSCQEIDTRLDGASGMATAKVWKVYATFLEGSSPRLSGITWGIHYDEQELAILGGGMCGDFELNGDGWPDPDTGSSVTWDSPQTGLVTPVYWFAGYAYIPTVFTMIGNPVGGGWFGDDAVPANLDWIASYGSLGFDMPGELACPNLEPGACCDPYDAECTITLITDCDAPHLWYPGYTSCEPNPCPPPWGSCCNLCDGSCHVTLEEDCTGADYLWNPDYPHCDPNPCPAVAMACCSPIDGGCQLVPCPSLCAPPGIVHQEWTSCEPNPCPPPTPVERKSWGSIKASYR